MTDNGNEYPPVPEQMAKMTPQERREATQRSKEIDAYLKEEGKRLDPANHINLILLGPGDSGKSTVLKQMILLHGSGFSDDNRREYKQIMYANILSSMKILVSAVDTLRLVWPSEDVKAKAGHILTMQQQDLNDKPEQVRSLYQELLQLDVIQQSIQQGDKIGLNDTAMEFLGKLDVYLTQEFLPSDAEILLCRRKTEHISETIFEIDKKFWHLIDVAGQKDKRSRWTAYFEKNLAGTIYVFSAACFCQMMDEDPTQNRMNDSLLLYNSLLVNTFLKLNSIIVFFNKYDLIDEKLKKYKIADFLPEYDGTNDKKAWIAWLEKKFGEKADQHNVVLHKHKTTATDPKLMKKVIESVKELIFRDQSKNLGLI